MLCFVMLRKALLWNVIHYIVITPNYKLDDLTFLFSYPVLSPELGWIWGLSWKHLSLLIIVVSPIGEFELLKSLRAGTWNSAVIGDWFWSCLKMLGDLGIPPGPLAQYLMNWSLASIVVLKGACLIFFFEISSAGTCCSAIIGDWLCSRAKRLGDLGISPGPLAQYLMNCSLTSIIALKGACLIFFFEISSAGTCCSAIIGDWLCSCAKCLGDLGIPPGPLAQYLMNCSLTSLIVLKGACLIYFFKIFSAGTWCSAIIGDWLCVLICVCELLKTSWTGTCHSAVISDWIWASQIVLVESRFSYGPFGWFSFCKKYEKVRSC